MQQRKVEKVQVSQLKHENATVFYAANPDEYPNVLPEYMTTTDRGGWEWVWVIFWGEKNPYIKPVPKPILPAGTQLAGLINPLESDWF
jgi:hypothetical protein